MLDILQVTDPGCCGIRQVDEDGCCVTCGIDFCDPETGEEIGDGTRVPNAALSGAAFDLLEALEAINDGVEGDNISMPEWLWNDVHAAIAKARGE